jgi:hypothetical protein
MPNDRWGKLVAPLSMNCGEPAAINIEIANHRKPTAQATAAQHATNIPPTTYPDMQYGCTAATTAG